MRRRLKRRAIRTLERAGLLQRVLDARTNRSLRLAQKTERRILGRMPRAEREFPSTNPKYAAAVDDHYGVLARRRDRCSVAEVMEANRRFVCDVLADEGIDYAALPVDSRNRARVAVSAEDKSRVLEALRQAAGPATYVYLDRRQIARGRRVARLQRRRPDPGPAAAAEVWRVYEPVVAGGLVLGHIHGCEIEFWRPRAEGRQLRSARWNRVALRVDRESFGAGTARLGTGTVAVTPGTLEKPYLEDITFPVDLVYTWVDGSDPEWLRSKAEVFGDLDLAAVNDEAANDARYQSFDELKYSLRSAEMYADFARHIYLVTDRQRPPWLVDDHPRLTVVDHREIFGCSDALPTFNSHAIESRLHHIPGLAEHYVYLNDDFFFARRVLANTFFHGNGLAKFFQSRALMPVGEPTVDTMPANAAAMNGRALLERQFGVLVSRKYKHVPYPQRRDVLLDIERLFPEEVERTTASRVRNPADLALASSLHHHMAYVTGRAVPASIRSEYVGTGTPNLRGQLAALGRRTDLDVFCLNDDGVDAESFDEVFAVTTEFLESRFPFASSFERSPEG